jgi:hypothetical protein
LIFVEEQYGRDGLAIVAGPEPTSDGRGTFIESPSSAPVELAPEPSPSPRKMRLGSRVCILFAFAAVGFVRLAAGLNEFVAVHGESFGGKIGVMRILKTFEPRYWGRRNVLCKV